MMLPRGTKGTVQMGLCLALLDSADRVRRWEEYAQVPAGGLAADELVVGREDEENGLERVAKVSAREVIRGLDAGNNKGAPCQP